MTEATASDGSGGSGSGGNGNGSEAPARDTRRRAGDPPGPVFLLVLGVTVLVSLWQSTLPNRGSGPAVALAAAWFGLAVAWVWLVVRALLRPDGRARLLRRRGAWLVVPLIVVAVGAAGFTGLPLRAGVAVSESALRDTAVAVSEGRDADLGLHGIYQVTAAERIPGGALLSVGGGGGWFYVDGGLAYVPHGTPSAGGREVYFEHIGGPWYRWWEQW